VVIRFVDIGEIVDYRALFKLYFHNTNKKRHAVFELLQNNEL